MIKRILLLIIILIIYLILTSNRKNIINIDGYKYINKELKLQIINKNNCKILIIDNFLKSPNSYLKLLNKKYFKYDTGSDFPGYRIPAHEDLNKEINNFIKNQISNKIFVTEGDVLKTRSSYSIISGKNSNLTLGNMLPHRDCIYYKTYKYSGIASVIYLCNPCEKYGGTGIYKQLTPIGQPYFHTDPKYSYERIKLEETVKKKIYCADEDEIFYKKLYVADVKFNRAIFYPTNYFHQPIINHKYFNEIMNIEDKQARLTITSWQIYSKKIKLNDTNDNIFEDADDRADPYNNNFEEKFFKKRIKELYNN